MHAYLALLLLLATTVKGYTEGSCVSAEDEWYSCDLDTNEPIGTTEFIPPVDEGEVLYQPDPNAPSNQGALVPNDMTTTPPQVSDAAPTPNNFPTVGSSIIYSMTLLGGSHTIEPVKIRLNTTFTVNKPLDLRYMVKKVPKVAGVSNWKLHKISTNYYAFEYVGALLATLRTDSRLTTAKFFLTVVQPVSTDLSFTTIRNRFKLQQYLSPLVTTDTTYLNNPVVTLAPYTTVDANGIPTVSSFGKAASFQAIGLFEGVADGSFKINSEKTEKAAVSVAFAPAWTANMKYDRRYLGVIPVKDYSTSTATTLLTCPYKYVRNTWSATGVNDYSLSLLSTGRDVAFELN